MVGAEATKMSLVVSVIANMMINVIMDRITTISIALLMLMGVANLTKADLETTTLIDKTSQEVQLPRMA